MKIQSLLIFVLFASCFSSTLDSAVSIDSSKLSLVSKLYKDSVLNYCYYVNENKRIKMDYLGINYSKQLDSNSFEFKQIMNYKTSKIFYTISCVGFSTAMIFALFVPGGCSSGGYDGRAGIGIDPIFCITATSFGYVSIFLNKKCNKILFKLINKPKP